MAPLTKEELEKTEIRPGHAAFDATYTVLKEKQEAAATVSAAISGMDAAQQEQLISSASSSRQRRGRPAVTDPPLDQLNEVAKETAYAHQAFTRLMLKEQEVRETLMKAETEKDGKTGKGV
ncbi:hypothetical protein NLG97_g1524 [Lecanicillium saksenae]|uniref:Uncharacterized protein n=1 Tax=Lecanicillium saksenae TaxID=468837 RepID=A0ACC1R471_9HYPO|nr:hypothetical protein NLG97_g1524 [Lecanicillium saksenae]